MDKPIQTEDIRRFAERFAVDPKNRLAMNAVTKNDIATVALSRDAVTRVRHIYSHVIETPEATDQKSSGRCWLFAGLNMLRLTVMRKLNLEQFELSQTYLMFWDKLEKINFFLEAIIQTRDEPRDGRLVMCLLADPIPDGGQWDMFVNLVKKYGVVPKSVVPETYSSSSSKTMNALLAAKMREGAQVLRELHAQGASLEALSKAKDELLADCYTMLSIHLGQPPESFVWEWRDKEKKFHRHGTITPQEFMEQYVDCALDDYVCLINAPTADKPYDRLYTVSYLGNVVEGQPVHYINAEIEVLKQASAAMIADGKPVWFGCDVSKLLERQTGALDLEIYDYELLYGLPFKQDKAGRLDYGDSQMGHAMVLTGVNLDDEGKPLQWRVENSWGGTIGEKGYLVMSDPWFEEFLYEVVVDKAYLSPELVAVLDTDPLVLPPWDPMGSLAKAY